MQNDIFLNLHHIIAAGWRRRYTIVLPIIIMPFIAALVGVMSQKTYQNHTTLLVQETSRMNPFLEDFSVSTQLKERMTALKALLHSRHVLSSVIDEINGDISDKPTTEADIARLSSKLSVQLIGSDMVKIAYKDSNPSEMKRTLEVVSKHFLNKLLAPEKSSIGASEDFLKSQLERHHLALIAAENKLSAFKSENVDRLPEQYQYNVKTLRELGALREEKLASLAGAKAALKSLSTQLLKTNPMISSVEETIMARTAQLAILKSKYTDSHSKVITLTKELKRLESQRDSILKETNSLANTDIEKLWQLATNLTDQYEGGIQRPLLVSQLEAIEQAKSRYQQLEQELVHVTARVDQLKANLEQFGATEQQLTELQRDIATNKQVYNDLLKRYEMAKVTGALGRFEESERIKIIDRPFVPVTPMTPPLSIYLIAGILGGLAIGLCAAFLLEISNTKIVKREIVENIVGVPVITRLPRFEFAHQTGSQNAIAQAPVDREL